MLGIEVGDIIGHILKGVVIAFGVGMVLFIIRSMKKNKLDQQGNKPGGPEQKP